jgi:hypothetical protein
MTKNKNTRPPKAATGTPHLFLHRCQSGNVIFAKMSVPRPGERTGFDILWTHSPTVADQREKKRWLRMVASTLNRIAGRVLTMRIFGDPATPVDSPAAGERAV